jgi:hypothetical protein
MLVSWLGTEYTIRGKVLISPKSELWWVLWVRVCLWLVRAPKVLQLCNNQVIVWFVQVRVSSWLLVNLPNPDLGTPAHPSTLKMLRAKERAPTPSPSNVFTFGLAIESIEELGGASISLFPKELNIITQKLLRWGRCTVPGTKTQPFITTYRMWHPRIPTPLGTYGTHVK